MTTQSDHATLARLLKEAADAIDQALNRGDSPAKDSRVLALLAQADTIRRRLYP